MASRPDSAVECSALSSIDNEIKDLYEHCKSIGLKDDEIRKLAKPLLLHLDLGVSKATRKRLFTIIVSCVFATFVFSLGFVQDAVYVYSRFGLLKILPYVDWEPLYRSPCAVENPFYVNNKNRITTKDCEICEDLKTLDVRKDVISSDILENYMENDVPVIIADAMNDWEARKPTAFDSLIQGYLNDPKVSDTIVCMFDTNLRVSNHISLLRKISSKTGPTRWFAHWENCELINQKYVRKFYQRPYFLPSGFEMTLSNWILISSMYKGRSFKLIDPEERSNVVWFGQILGENRIRLLPTKECQKMCHEITITLVEGHIVLIPLRMWTLMYAPGENNTNLAIVVAGYSN